MLLPTMLLASCSQDEASSDPEHQNITVNIESFKEDLPEGSRSTLTLDEQKGFLFRWSAGDEVGYSGKTENSEDLQQLRMRMISGDNATKAHFSSVYQPKKDGQYVAYFPYQYGETKENPFRGVIAWDYTGQVQKANGDYSHLPDKDFMASPLTTAPADGTIDFSMSHVGCILRLQLTMPKAGSYSSVIISTADDSQAFTKKENIDLFGSDTKWTLTPTETSSSLTLGLGSASADGSYTGITTTADNEVLTAYLMLAPVDLSSKGVKITVKPTDTTLDDVVFNWEPGKNMISGRSYTTKEALTVDDPNKGSVDLGLGVIWADHNVGANSPEETGDLFAWGEIQPKSSYSLNNYKWGRYSSYYTKYRSGIDDRKTLLMEDDAARQNMGGTWRMPTQAEVQQLINNCTWTRTTLNGVDGYQVSSGGSSIFLPLNYYNYWTNEVVTLYGFENDYAVSLHLDRNPRYIRLANSSYSSYVNRYSGQMVRAVRDR